MRDTLLGFNAEAEPLLRRSVALSEDIYGPDSREVAEPLHHLARIYWVNGDYEGALEMYRRVLAIHESFQPGNDAEVGESLNNISLSFAALERHEEAESSLARALRIYKVASPPDPRAIAVSQSNLGACYWDMGRIDESLRHYAAAMETAKVLAPSHPVRTGIILRMASIINELGRHEQAEELLEEVVAQSLITYGEDSSFHATSLERLSVAKHYAGKLGEARQLAYQALEIYRERGDEVSVANVLTILGESERARGRLDDAQELLDEALEIRARILPETDSDLAETLARIGSLKSQMGEFEEAEGFLHEALRIVEDSASDPILLAFILVRLGKHYEGAGEHAKALDHLSRASALQIDLFGENHWAVAFCKERMADAHRKEGRFEESERLLLESPH